MCTLSQLRCQQQTKQYRIKKASSPSFLTRLASKRQATTGLISKRQAREGLASKRRQHVSCHTASGQSANKRYASSSKDEVCRMPALCKAEWRQRRPVDAILGRGSFCRVVFYGQQWLILTRSSLLEASLHPKR